MRGAWAKSASRRLIVIPDGRPLHIKAERHQQAPPISAEEQDTAAIRPTSGPHELARNDNIDLRVDVVEAETRSSPNRARCA
jgi:hypothetical protein